MRVNLVVGLYYGGLGFTTQSSLETDNGEDHYSLSGTYTKPKNWSPPAGLDGPFYGIYGLKYPYYEYIYGVTDYINTWYGGFDTNILSHVLVGEAKEYYGKRNF